MDFYCCDGLLSKVKNRVAKILSTIVLALSAFAALAQQSSDTANIALSLDAMAFFDNKEFTNGIKKGYTLPGFNIDPALTYRVGRFGCCLGQHHAFSASYISNSRATISCSSIVGAKP